MAVTHATRNPSSNLTHAIVIVAIALGLVISAFALGAVASYAGVNLLSHPSAVQPALQPAPTLSPSASARPTAESGKVIVVSIKDQRLTAYDGDQVFLATVVATGRPELPTPVGTFHIQSKASPYKFISPWPKGDPYWYPTEWVSYAMLFADGGYFLHDAPWRTVWGPGANVTQGSHGCVNVPTAVMARLYNWAEVGTTVVIQ